MHLNPLLLTLVLTMTTLHAQTPPDVEKRPHTVTSPHGERQDEYYWLRDDERKDPQMLAYLNAENAYADAVLAPLQAQEDKLYDEIVARIKQDDSSVPERDRGYWYYTRFETGKDYPVHARRADRVGLDAVSIQAANNRTTKNCSGRMTPTAAASTPCASPTSRAASALPTKSPAPTVMPSGRTTARPSTTSKTTPTPCSANG